MIDIWHGLLYLFAHMYDAAVTTMLYRSVILYYLSPAVVSVRICCALPASCIAMRSFALCIPLRWACYKPMRDCNDNCTWRVPAVLAFWSSRCRAYGVDGEIAFSGLTTCELLLEILLRKQPSTDPRTA